MNLCPSEDTYCDINLTHETCLYHNTGAECIHRKRVT